MTGSLAVRPYTRGLHDLGNGAWAWLQPGGSRGWSNAGLVVDGEHSLLPASDIPLADCSSWGDAARIRRERRQ